MISADARDFMKGLLEGIAGVDAETVLGTIQEKYGKVYQEDGLPLWPSKTMYE